MPKSASFDVVRIHYRYRMVWIGAVVVIIFIVFVDVVARWEKLTSRNDFSPESQRTNRCKAFFSNLRAGKLKDCGFSVNHLCLFCFILFIFRYFTWPYFLMHDFQWNFNSSRKVYLFILWTLIHNFSFLGSCSRYQQVHDPTKFNINTVFPFVRHLSHVCCPFTAC